MKRTYLTLIVTLLLSICLAGEHQNARWQLFTEAEGSLKIGWRF